MRILLFFDLPMVECEEKSEYRHFHTFLVKSGFIMLQQSVYAKMVPNKQSLEATVATLQKKKPPKGHIQILPLTEGQYQKQISLLGSHQTTVLDTQERVVIV